MRQKTFTNLSLFGSVNIPLEMCEALGFKQGQRVEVTMEDGKIVIQAAAKRHYFKRAVKKVQENVSSVVRGKRGRKSGLSVEQSIKQNIDRQRKDMLKEEWEESPTAI
jgi:antitoxin component of MazEF toxin-antitoxin module